MSEEPQLAWDQRPVTPRDLILFIGAFILLGLVTRGVVIRAGIMTSVGSQGTDVVQEIAAPVAAQPSILVPYSEPSAQSAREGQVLFQEICVACHTIGSGIVVGPDLQGVTARRERDWLARWIKEPDKMLAEGDPIGTQQLQEFNNVPMPNLGMTDQQVDTLIAYLQTTDTSAATTPVGLPALYVPTLVAAVVVLLALTALGLGVGKKQVEVRI
ncbi:MAG TPA: cytochrome c [Anaerolineales bacterium]|jgi:mono/diheme cytochrome c family protein|nr:cytochrome c [Anaerolineales bacterium]|tara:strand:- start:134 stop:775 length:642 start_codon:yes stop_codon:yes gene_type:complete